MQRARLDRSSDTQQQQQPARRKGEAD